MRKITKPIRRIEAEMTWSGFLICNVAARIIKSKLW